MTWDKHSSVPINVSYINRWWHWDLRENSQKIAKDEEETFVVVLVLMPSLKEVISNIYFECTVVIKS